MFRDSYDTHRDRLFQKLRVDPNVPTATQRERLDRLWEIQREGFLPALKEQYPLIKLDPLVNTIRAQLVDKLGTECRTIANYQQLQSLNGTGGDFRDQYYAMQLSLAPHERETQKLIYEIGQQLASLGIPPKQILGPLIKATIADMRQVTGIELRIQQNALDIAPEADSGELFQTDE